MEEDGEEDLQHVTEIASGYDPELTLYCTGRSMQDVVVFHACE